MCRATLTLRPGLAPSAPHAANTVGEPTRILYIVKLASLCGHTVWHSATQGDHAMTNSITTPTKAAKRLNDHHMRTCAGFYGPGERYFQARVRNGILQVTPDFGRIWRDVDLETIDLRSHFHDHNGQPISLR